MVRPVGADHDEDAQREDKNHPAYKTQDKGLIAGGSTRSSVGTAASTGAHASSTNHYFVPGFCSVMKTRVNLSLDGFHVIMTQTDLTSKPRTGNNPGIVLLAPTRRSRASSFLHRRYRAGFQLCFSFSSPENKRVGKNGNRCQPRNRRLHDEPRVGLRYRLIRD